MPTFVNYLGYFAVSLCFLRTLRRSLQGLAAVASRNIFDFEFLDISSCCFFSSYPSSSVIKFQNENSLVFQTETFVCPQEHVLSDLGGNRQ
jgi:hypothetical protein